MEPSSSPFLGRICLSVSLLLGATACAIPQVSQDQRAPEALPQNSIIYAIDGTPITTLHAEQDRVVVPIDRIPEVVQDAVVAIEDKRFWSHRGIDLKALIRAAYVNATKGRIVEGGSTITQQYVKNTLVGNDRTLKRKIREARLAWELEHDYSKAEILGKYLNTIYFGKGAYGIQSAAKKYFSKPASQLNLSEAALLAGLIAAPERYDPVDVPDDAIGRRNSVLARMKDLGMIEEPAYLEAAGSKLGLRLAPEKRHHRAAYFVEYVKEQILHDPLFGETDRDRYDFLFKGGLRIHTTIDLEMQRAAEKAVGGVLSQPGDPYGALTALDPRTGHIKAMVGGRDFFAKPHKDPVAQVNLASGDGGTGRQAGSAFKPFALVAALASGISPQKTYQASSSITIPLGYGAPWHVENYEGSGFGDLTLEEATIDSVNVVFAQLIMELGPERVADTAYQMGIRSRLRSVPSAVLGTNEVNTLEMASAFGTLAANGAHAQPVAIERITDAAGRVLYEAEPILEEVLNPGVAWITTQILRKVILYGTGVAANIGRPAAGKTGTAQQWRDAWFAGYIPQLTAAVWVGFPQAQIPMVPPTTRIRVTGGSFPAQIWHAFMTAVTRRMPVEDFTKPEAYFANLAVDITQGCLANEQTPSSNVRVVTFVRGTEPGACTTVSAPPPALEAEVPSLVGLPIEEAERLLEETGFLSARETEFHPEYPEGTVIGQTPEPGASATVGSPITLVVTSQQPPLVVVPSVLGQTEQQAQTTLGAAGFEVAVTGATDPSTYPVGAVTAQKPGAGKQKPPGSTVTITVNRGVPSPAPLPSPT
jgi:penicillin-binding protein 1A